MPKICLALPTHRACDPTLSAVAGEAVYAVRALGADVTLLVLDSSGPQAYARHAETLAGLPRVPGLEVVHLDEAAQRRFLQAVTSAADVPKPDLIVDLMLPPEVSYGACTNRAFLFAAALGCESVHRRDSDLSYQECDGLPVYPIEHELKFLGRPALDAARDASEVALDPVHGGKPVVMVGGSFVGELSVDIDDIRRREPEVYHDIVGLWAADGTTAEEVRELVDESFTGAGTEAFTADRTVLGLVDPMRVDMCNISFYRVHEEVPLPPMTDTIGSDYFMIHLVPDCRLPGVLHNRHVVNFHTPERRTEAAMLAYHLRLAKFFLSMLYLHAIYQAMGEAGEALLDENHRVRTPRIAALVRDSVLLDRAANVRRLDTLGTAYRRLGGRYTAVADLLAERREQMLAGVAQDFADFATLIEAWASLVEAGRAAGRERAWERP